MSKFWRTGIQKCGSSRQLCTVNFQFSEGLSIKNTKGKWLRCEVTVMLIALAVVSIFYSPWGRKESAVT